MGYYELTDSFEVAADPAACWDFFSAAENLPLITPPWLDFRVRTPAPVTIGAEALLDYTIRWMGAAVKWRTKIIEWSPPRQFIDLQIRGPYALWMHQHTFMPTAAGAECRDRVVYRLPVPLLGRVMHAAVVRLQLLEIFRFRRRVIGERLGWGRAIQPDVEVRRL